MNKLCVIFLIIAGMFYLSSNLTSAQVVINEVSSATDTEWVELFNTSSSSASLQNYSIYFDASSTTQKRLFCDNDSIPPLGYKIIHITSHYLNNTGDTVILKIGDDNTDSISYGTGQTLKAPTSTQSISRSPDGAGSWLILDLPSPTGEEVSFSCPTPTPEPTPTQNPTPVPTNTPSPIPTPTKTPTPVPSRTPTPRPTITPIPVLGAETSSVSANVEGLLNLGNSPIPTTKNPKNSENAAFPFLAVGIIAAGVILVGGAFYMAFRKSKLELPR